MAPPMTTRFRLRMLADLTVSGIPRRGPPRGRIGRGPAGEAMVFEIQDVEHKQSAFYDYTGLGLGVGASALWLSATTAGPWNDFTTSAAMSVGDFGGLARFTTAGGGAWTWNWLHIINTPEGVDRVYMMIQTGFTYGVGATTTVGRFSRMAGPMPSGDR